MRRSGFTMIELVIVLAILAVIAGPFFAIVVSQYKQIKALTMQADLKSETERAAAKVFRLTATHATCKLDADNHGMACADGTAVRWKNQEVILTERGRSRSLVPYPVHEFALVRHGKVLTLNLAVSGPTHAGGPAVSYRYIYDYPRMEER